MNPQACIKVALIDDHALVRDGIRALLMAVPELDVVGEAGSGAEALGLHRHVDGGHAATDNDDAAPNGQFALVVCLAQVGDAGRWVVACFSGSDGLDPGQREAFRRFNPKSGREPVAPAAPPHPKPKAKVTDDARPVLARRPAPPASRHPMPSRPRGRTGSASRRCSSPRLVTIAPSLLRARVSTA